MMFWKATVLVLIFATCLHGLYMGGDVFRNDYRQEQMYRDQQRMQAQIIGNRLESYNQRMYNNPQWRPYKSSVYRQDLKYGTLPTIKKDYKDYHTTFDEPIPTRRDPFDESIPTKMKSDKTKPQNRDSEIKFDKTWSPVKDSKTKSSETRIPPRGDSKMKSSETRIPPRGDSKMKSSETRIPPRGDSKMIKNSYNGMNGNWKDSFIQRYKQKPMSDNGLFLGSGDQYRRLRSDQYNRNIPRKLYNGLFIDGRDEFQNDYRQKQIIANRVEDYNQRIYDNPLWRPSKSSVYRQDLLYRRPPMGKDYESTNELAPPSGDSTIKANEPAPPQGDSTIYNNPQWRPYKPSVYRQDLLYRRPPMGKDYKSSLCCRLGMTCCSKDAFQKDSRQEQMYQDLLMNFIEQGPPLGDTTRKSNEPGPQRQGDSTMKIEVGGFGGGNQYRRLRSDQYNRNIPRKQYNDMFGNLEDSYKPQYQRKPMLDNELFGRGRVGGRGSGDQLDNKLFVRGGFGGGDQYRRLHSSQYNRNTIN